MSSMTPRQRLLTVLRGEIPDRVPVAPDFSGMIPARLTGKPFWDLYLYNDPPIWEAYVACARHFGIDSLMDGYFPLQIPDPKVRQELTFERFIVYRNDERIVVQSSWKDNGKRVWDEKVAVYYRADPPTHGVDPEKIGLPRVPARFKPLEGVKPVDLGPNGLKRIKEMLGDQGLVGVWGGASTCAFGNPDGVYSYYDNPDKHEQWARERIETAEKRFAQIQSLDVRPDFLCVGGSGTLVFGNVAIVRKISLPAVKRAVELATQAGYPTHVHSCGPEKELVKMMVEETSLTVIDPLEVPPMGDCNLAELKQNFGKRITLKGNLHTTEVMLMGSPNDVRRAAIQAMRDAGRGGRFILSTGDQCGRDTPDANLRALAETVEEYGVYDHETGELPKLPRN
jgi:uroporphyrinogen decarboxylase